MGGSSGGGWSSLGDIRSLEEKAKAALQEGRRNVFISFATEDMMQVNALRMQARNENNDIEFNDHSVKEPYESDRAEYIKRKISERISRTSVCVVYLSENTAQSQWVEWEAKRSLELGKRVIAVHAGPAYTGRRPEWIAHHNIPVIAWSELSKELRK